MSPDELKNIFNTTNTNFAEFCYEWLIHNLGGPPFHGCEKLIQDLREYKSEYLSIFKPESSITKNIFRFHVILHTNLKNGNLNDTAFIYDASGILYILMLDCEKFNLSKERLTQVEQAHKSCFYNFLKAVNTQVETLCAYLDDIKYFISGLHLKNSQIWLLDIPVGNTLPTGILERILGSKNIINKVSLALHRNDSRRLGVTRGELLQEILMSTRFNKNDLLLYFDEWNTGANFYNICSIIKKYLPKDIFFLPIAALSVNSCTDPNFQKYCKSHDQLMQAWGINGKRFRREFPKLNTKIKIPFFWSENDRMAGYRKLQVHGSMFSTIDNAIQTLVKDDQELKKAILITLPQIPELEFSVEESVSTLSLMFREQYEVYEKYRDKFKNSADSQDPVVSSDLESCLPDLWARYEEVFGEGLPKLLFILAINYMDSLGDPDFVDQYYFKHHVPLISPLQGRMARIHELAMEFLLAQFDA